MLSGWSKGLNGRELHSGYTWYYLFSVQSIKMKVKRFGLAIIIFLGILILSMSVCTDYDIAYAQGGEVVNLKYHLLGLLEHLYPLQDQKLLVLL